MAFYVTIFIVLLFFSFVEVFTKKNLFVKILYWSTCLFLFMLSFLRWETGTDWVNYYNYFQRVLYHPYEYDEFEVGFRVLNYAVRSFTNEYTVLLFFSGLMLFFFQSKAIKELSPFPLLSLTCLFASQAANILFVRQWMAIAILFYSIVYIKRRKFLPFLLLVLLAITIHRSAGIFIFAYWIFKAKISVKWMMIWLVSTVVFSLFIQNLLNSLLGNLGNLVIEDKLNTYLSESYNSGLNKELDYFSILIRGVANKLFIFLLSIFVLLRNANQDNIRGFINIYWLGTMLYFVMLPISLALVRFSYPFDIVQIILIAHISNSFGKESRIIVFFIFSVYLFLRLFQFLKSAYSDEIIPYKFVI